MLNKSKIFIIALLLLAYGCSKEKEIEANLTNINHALLNEDSVKVSFPGYFKGKTAVMGFIFTNCPDICPLTTNNMQRIQKQLEKEGIYNVEFISLSFDPERDKPSVLKEYARIREIDTKNWHFLTGSKEAVDALKKEMHFMAIPGDTSYTEDRRPYYFFVHTDRISLIDPESRVIKNYKGSSINIEEIVRDIKKL